MLFNSYSETKKNWAITRESSPKRKSEKYLHLKTGRSGSTTYGASTGGTTNKSNFTESFFRVIQSLPQKYQESHFESPPYSTIKEKEELNYPENQGNQTTNSNEKVPIGKQPENPNSQAACNLNSLLGTNLGPFCKTVQLNDLAPKINELMSSPQSRFLKSTPKQMQKSLNISPLEVKGTEGKNQVFLSPSNGLFGIDSSKGNRPNSSFSMAISPPDLLKRRKSVFKMRTLNESKGKKMVITGSYNTYVQARTQDSSPLRREDSSKSQVRMKHVPIKVFSSNSIGFRKEKEKKSFSGNKEKKNIKCLSHSTSRNGLSRIIKKYETPLKEPFFSEGSPGEMKTKRPFHEKEETQNEPERNNSAGKEKKKAKSFSLVQFPAYSLPNEINKSLISRMEKINGLYKIKEKLEDEQSPNTNASNFNSVPKMEIPFLGFQKSLMSISSPKADHLNLSVHSHINKKTKKKFLYRNESVSSGQHISSTAKIPKEKRYFIHSKLSSCSVHNVADSQMECSEHIPTKGHHKRIRSNIPKRQLTFLKSTTSINSGPSHNPANGSIMIEEPNTQKPYSLFKNVVHVPLDSKYSERPRVKSLQYEKPRGIEKNMPAFLWEYKNVIQVDLNEHFKKDLSDQKQETYSENKRVLIKAAEKMKRIEDAAKKESVMWKMGDVISKTSEALTKEEMQKVQGLFLAHEGTELPSKAVKEIERTLRKLKFFSKLSKRKRKSIVSKGVLRGYGKGEVIFERGEEETGQVFIVLKGAVQLSSHKGLASASMNKKRGKKSEQDQKETENLGKMARKFCLATFYDGMHFGGIPKEKKLNIEGKEKLRGMSEVEEWHEKRKEKPNYPWIIAEKNEVKEKKEIRPIRKSTAVALEESEVLCISWDDLKFEKEKNEESK